MDIDYGPFNTILLILSFIGVAIHEISHFIMCIIVGVRPKGISVRLRSRLTGKVSPHGYVKPETHHYTFLQAAFISLAPTIFSTWLIFWSLSIIFSAESIESFIRVAAGLFCLSNFFGAAPSRQDLILIGHWFSVNPRYSFFQLGLLILSGFGVWAIVNYYHIILSLDIIYYILVGIGYYVLKYTFRAIAWILNKLIFLYNPHRANFPRIKYGRLIRKRFKPSKPSKTGKREAPW